MFKTDSKPLKTLPKSQKPYKTHRGTKKNYSAFTFRNASFETLRLLQNPLPAQQILLISMGTEAAFSNPLYLSETGMEPRKSLQKTR